MFVGDFLRIQAVQSNEIPHTLYAVVVGKKLEPLAVRRHMMKRAVYRALLPSCAAIQHKKYKVLIFPQRAYDGNARECIDADLRSFFSRFS